MKKEESAQYHLRLPQRLKLDLEKRAERDRRSLNQHIVITLENVVEKERTEQLTVTDARA